MHKPNKSMNCVIPCDPFRIHESDTDCTKYDHKSVLKFEVTVTKQKKTIYIYNISNSAHLYIKLNGIPF